MRAVHQYLDIPVQASFHSGDEELDRIFAVAAHTFMLCSGPFFLDGVKRDTVVVSHGGVSRVLRGHILGLDLKSVPLLDVPQDRVLVLRHDAIDWL